MAEKILITSALPYANGSIHIGHLVEYIQTDIYVRFLRSCGRDVIYLCADDTHGTPIEVNAARQGVSPESFVQRFWEEHRRDFADFHIGFDEFWSTHSDENRHYAELIYGRLREAGEIDRKEIEQFYCEKDRRFLPDRFIRGTCPNCKAENQYGDVCEVCGKTHEPTELIDPTCALCGSPPVRRKSAHLFFRLSKHQDELLERIRRPGFLHPAVSNQLQQFAREGLSDWDISRDGPYFGFPIPGEQDKFFYVWLDAPIGYISTTERWAKRTGKAKDALDYWAEDASSEIVHFIGKDIVYFHALFWPAVLRTARFKRPSRIIVHGHLTVNHQKMSKSRGTMVPARRYLDLLDPTYLRFFYAANLGPGPEDFDLSLEDFRLRVNGELVNNLGNLVNRSLSMLSARLGGKLSDRTDGPGAERVRAALAKVPEVRSAFEQLDFRQAIRMVVEIGQSANQFLQERAPWKTEKSDPEAARADLTDAAEIAYLIGGLLQPVVPKLSEKLFEQLGAPPLTFEMLEKATYPLLDRARPLGTPAPLVARLDAARVGELVPPVEGAAEAAPPGAKKKAPAAAAKKAEKVEQPEAAVPGQIEYGDFEKVVLRVGKVEAAERIPKADKLLKLTVDVGEGGPRTIAAGIAEAYLPEQLVGRNVVVLVNLKPRKLRGIESQGMLLAAGPGGKEISLLDPGAMPPGTEVK